jgi:hypothetical protein
MTSPLSKDEKLAVHRMISAYALAQPSQITLRYLIPPQAAGSPSIRVNPPSSSQRTITRSNLRIPLGPPILFRRSPRLALM